MKRNNKDIARVSALSYVTSKEKETKKEVL